MKKYQIIVIFGGYAHSVIRYDYQKARDIYTDCLVKYPNNEVQFNTIEP